MTLSNAAYTLDTDPQPRPIAHFCQSQKNPALKPLPHDWTALADALGQHIEIAEKTACGGFIFADFATPYRKRENVTAYYGLVLDIEPQQHNGEWQLPPQPEDVGDRLEGCDLEGVIYTSHSHMVEPHLCKPKDPSQTVQGVRYRVVVPLNRPITTDIEQTLKHHTLALAEKLALLHYLDPASYVVSQFFYMPAHRPNYPKYAAKIAGQAWDVDQVLTLLADLEALLPNKAKTAAKAQGNLIGLVDLRTENYSTPLSTAGGFDAVKQAAQGRWSVILPSLSIPLPPINKHAPCPACGGTDRFRFVDQDGHGTFFCGQGGNGTVGGDGFALIQHAHHCDHAAALKLVRDFIMPTFGQPPQIAVQQPIPSGGTKTTTADTWGEPLPLGGVEPPAPVYPVEAFPAIARDAIQAIAWHVQAPMGLAGQCVLGTMAYIAQIHVNAPDLHKPEGMPCSLFILTEGASGDRKSACHDLADKVIKERERLMLEQYATDMKDYYAQVNDPNCKDEVQEPRNPKAIFTDATIESIVSAFVESGVTNGAWISDEGGHFFGGATMKGDTMKNALSVLVKFFDKGMADRFRSKSNANGSGTVYDVRLMFNLLGQREVLREALTDPLLRGQGFLPRFIFAAPQSLAGDRPLTRERMRSKSYADLRLQRFWEHYGNLLPDPAMPVGDITNLAAYDGVLVRPVLELDDAAADVWLEFYNHTERLQKAESKYEYMRPFAGRAGELARRVAAVFACFEQKDLIDEAAMRGACAVVQYSLDEWLRYADAAQLSVADQQAQRLEIWLISECKKQGVTSLARAHVMQFCPMTALRKAKALNAALKLLCDAQRVRSEVQGRKQMIAVNPELFS